jgi:hypothetical protein
MLKRAMVISYPVVSLSSSKTESAPKEESDMKTRMKDAMGGTIISILVIHFHPKKQRTKPPTKCKPAQMIEESRSWVMPEGFSVGQPELWMALNSRVHSSESLTEENLS